LDRENTQGDLDEYVYPNSPLTDPKILSNQQLLGILLGGSVAPSLLLSSSLNSDIINYIEACAENLSIKTQSEALLASGLALSDLHFLRVGVEFYRRMLYPSQNKVTSAKDVYQLTRHYSRRKEENLVVLSMSAASELIQIHHVSMGTVSTCIAHPREVFAPALVDRACAIFLVHNHPSNNAEPSPADIKITEGMVAAGKVLGIPLLDHLIITQKGYYSFAENRALYDFLKE
jgi:DNA repair protein RadC